jgi:serine/threonine protein kinase
VDRLLGRRVAVKVPFRQLAGDAAFVQRFRQEARSAARLSHPNVVAVFDVGSHPEGGGEFDYIVMEFVDGRTLRRVLQRGPLPPEQAAGVAAQMCAALQASHAAGLVHRDVKPGNVMLGSSGQVKVTDFGVARAADAARLTPRTGLVVATAQYAAPELLQGQDVDARSDVYSLGCCHYVSVHNRLQPARRFAGSDPVSVAYRQVHEQPTPSRQHDPLVPTGLPAVAARAMQKQPARRYQSAAEMAADLTRVLACDPPAGTPTAGDAGTIPIQVAAPGDPASRGNPDDWQPTAEPVGPTGLGRWPIVALVAAAFVLGAGFSLWLVVATPADHTAPRPARRRRTRPATAHWHPSPRRLHGSRPAPGRSHLGPRSTRHRPAQPQPPQRRTRPPPGPPSTPPASTPPATTPPVPSGPATT